MHHWQITEVSKTVTNLFVKGKDKNGIIYNGGCANGGYGGMTLCSQCVQNFTKVGYDTEDLASIY